MEEEKQEPRVGEFSATVVASTESEKETIDEKSAQAQLPEYEIIKIRKERIINFFKEKYNWIAYLMLVFIIYLAIKVRTSNVGGLKDITNGAWTLGPDLDPFLFLRLAKYIVEHGRLFEIDTMRYVPLGFDMGGEYLLHPYMMAWFHKIAAYFGSESITHSAILYPAFFFGITIVAFFLMTRKIFIDTMGEKNANAIALIASFFLSVVTILLPRTIAGIPEKESAAFFFLFISFYFFLLSWKTKKKLSRYIFAILGGMTTSGMAHIWGGYVFIFVTIAPAVFLAFLLGQLEKNKITSYGIWLFSSLLFMISFFGRHTIKSFFENITSSGAAAVVFFIVLLHEAIFETTLNEKIKLKKLSRIPARVVSVVISVILLSIFASILFGPLFIPNQVDNVLNTLIKPATSRLIQTVAENRQPYFNEWAGSFGPYYKNIPTMFLLFFFGSILLFYNSIKVLRKRERIAITVSYIFLLFSVIFSRYASNSALNGENFVSKFIYALGFIIFVVTSGAYYYKYFKNGEEQKLKEIEFGFLLLFSFFFLSIVAARAAVRTIMVLVPSVSIIVAYFVVSLTNDTIKAKDRTRKAFLVVILGIVVIATIFSASTFYRSVKAEAPAHVPSIYTQQWQKAMAWVRENTPETAVFGHWWDYGYWLQSIGERATILDGGNAIGYWNHLMGRHALTGTRDRDALEFLYAHNTTHFLIDSTDIGKYGAFSSIGSDGDYDRASYISTFVKNNQALQETKNSTIFLYQGGAGIDEDIVYENNGTRLFLPAGSAGIGAILVERDNENNEMLQPHGIFIYQGKQYTLPLRYAYDHEFIDFGSGLEAGVFLFPNAIQSASGIQIDQDGALLYLTKRTVKSQLARLYLYKENNQNFRLVHSEEDFFVAQIKSQNQGFNSDFVMFQGLRGPIRIWEIDYPSDIEFKEEYLNKNYPKEILYVQ